jgi:hypothetical protein
MYYDPKTEYFRVMGMVTGQRNSAWPNIGTGGVPISTYEFQ